MADLSKARLGKYELLLPPVGEGSEGLLYKACCVEDGVPGLTSGEFVALKRLRHIGREMRPDRFQRQAELLRKLNHPGIVRYKDSFVWRDEESEEGPEVYCLVTEWLEGQSLKGLIDQHPSGVPWEIAEPVLRQVLEALVYAGAQRVVHRDLKPSNIYLLPEGKVKLIDFGIARPMDAEATTTSTTASFEGTWNWMAPDFVRLQEDNFKGDERSDIYSFGVCFYQVLTGRFPYGSVGENPQFAYFQRWLAPAPPKLVPHQNLNVLKGARSCIQKCLEVDRSKRFQSFEELLQAFREIRYRQLRHTPEVYEYRRYLGQGGFGQVYRGTRLSDGLDIAIKELVAGQHARRFVREAKILQKAPHPHLVEYLDFVEVQPSHVGDDSRYFLVLEYLEGMPGSSLRDRIKDAKQELQPREMLILFHGYLECLEHLHQHEHRIIHRDIKPGNLYAPAGAPEKGKLFDLGIAHDEEGTRTHGQVPGTLDYMPPEFASPDSGRGSPQSDIYSLAVTLYEALTRSLPFPRLPPGEKAWVEYIARSLKPAECPFAHRVFEEYPELAALLRCALAYDPQQRFPSAKAMAEEIQKILDAWDRVNADFEAAMSAARAAFAQDDWGETERHVQEALQFRPRNPDATQLLAQSRARRQEQLDTAFSAAHAAWDDKDYLAAQRHAERALQLQPGSAAAQEWLARIEEAKRSLYETAIGLAQAALEKKDFPEVQRQASEALKFKAGDEAAERFLTLARDAEMRAQALARQQASLFTIQLPRETEARLPQPILLDDPLTQPTAPTLDSPPPAATEATPASISRTTGPGTSNVWAPEPPPSAVSQRLRKVWLPLAACAALALIGWVGFRLHAGKGNATVELSGSSGQKPATDTLDPRDVRVRLPELITNRWVQADPELRQVIADVPRSGTISPRDLASLQATLTHWWTSEAGLNTNLAVLPLGTQLQKRVHQERLNQTFPGVAAAFQLLGDTARERQVIASSLAQIVADWQEIEHKIASTPDLAAWRDFSVAPDQFQALVKLDFQRQLEKLLGGSDAPWTPSQYLQTFGTAKTQLISKLAAHYYAPPDKVAWLAKAKTDPQLSIDLRDFANLALNTELKDLQTLAQGHSSDSFSTWKTKLDSYHPVPADQLADVPSPNDVTLVERSLDQTAGNLLRSAAPGKEADAVQHRVQGLKKELTSVRVHLDSLQRAAAAGLISQDRLSEFGNQLSADLRSIHAAIRDLNAPAGRASLDSPSRQ